MSDEQETIPEANAPKPIRSTNDPCSLPVKPWPWNSIPQHHMCHEPVMEPHASKVASPPPMREYPQSYRNIAAASQSKAIRSNRSPIPPTLRSSVIPMPTPFSPSTRSLENR